MNDVNDVLSALPAHPGIWPECTLFWAVDQVLPARSRRASPLCAAVAPSLLANPPRTYLAHPRTMFGPDSLHAGVSLGRQDSPCATRPPPAGRPTIPSDTVAIRGLYPCILFNIHYSHSSPSPISHPSLTHPCEAFGRSVHLTVKAIKHRTAYLHMVITHEQYVRQLSCPAHSTDSESSGQGNTGPSKSTR